MKIDTIKRITINAGHIPVKYLFINLRPQHKAIDQTHDEIIAWLDQYHSERLVSCGSCSGPMVLNKIRVLAGEHVPNKILIELGYNCPKCGCYGRSTTEGAEGSAFIDSIDDAADLLERRSRPLGMNLIMN